MNNLADRLCSEGMKAYYSEAGVTIYQGSCRQLPLEDQSVNCCVTSPPYWGLRDYGVEGQLGLEATPAEYVARMVEVFREVRRVLRDDGTLWLNLGDSYAADAGADRKPTTLSGPRVPAGWTNRSQPTRIHASGNIGLKPKDLCMMPHRIAIALQTDGWWVRSDIIWHKPNPMPESVRDRPTKAHEYIFLLAKSEQYYYDSEAIKEPATDTGRINGRDGRKEDPAARTPNSNPRTLKRLDYSQVGRNKRSVWTVATQPYPEAHFATFPEDLIKPCILAGCPAGGVVLDPFGGSGTTMQVARFLGRRGTMVELNGEYCKMATKRLSQGVLPLESIAVEPITGQFVSEA